MDDITREEVYLSTMAGENVNLPDPVTRREYFLAKAAGMDVETPDPITREEMYLSQIQGGGGTSILPQIIDRSVTEITAEDLKGVTKIGGYAFAHCKHLSSVTIPDSVTSIDEYAFQACADPYGGLSEIIIPNSVTSIGASAFNVCDYLTKVILGNSVSFIGQFCFSYCSRLTNITSLNTTPPQLATGVIPTLDNLIIYVPAESVDLYKSTPGWSAFAQQIQAIPE